MSNIAKQLVRVDSVFEKGIQKTITIEKIKNLTTGAFEKKAHFDKNPDFHFFVSKPEHLQENPVTSINIDYVDRVDCKYKDLYPTLAKLTKRTKMYERLKEARDNRGMSRLHFHNDIHMSDSNLEDYHMREYYEKYKDVIQPLPVSKGFMDIEVDISDYEGFPDEEVAPCPINFISYINKDEQSLRFYILLDHNNASQAKFIEKNHNGTYSWNSTNCDWARITMDEHFQDKERPICSMKYLSVEFFEDELDLIKAYFEDYHADKLDVIGAWNAHFDFKTIEMRLFHLGVDPREVMCPSSFPYKKVTIRKDNYSQDQADKAHTLNISGWGHTVDMLYYYAAVRKGRGKKESMKLEDILLEEIGEGKFELKGTIQNAAHVDFENFLLYSGFDSFRLNQLEEKNNDIGLLYNMSLFTHTRLEKVMRKTTSIRNLAAQHFWKNGYVLSNNHNKFIEHEDIGKFQGAFVANALLMDKVGLMFNGEKSSNIFENVVDEDFAGLYPNIILAFQIDAQTLIGKIKSENPEINDNFGELISERDYIVIGTKVLGMPSFEEILMNLEHFLVEEAE